MLPDNILHAIIDYISPIYYNPIAASCKKLYHVCCNHVYNHLLYVDSRVAAPWQYKCNNIARMGIVELPMFIRQPKYNYQFYTHVLSDNIHDVVMMVKSHNVDFIDETKLIPHSKWHRSYICGHWNKFMVDSKDINNELYVFAIHDMELTIQGSKFPNIIIHNLRDWCIKVTIVHKINDQTTKLFAPVLVSHIKALKLTDFIYLHHHPYQEKYYHIQHRPTYIKLAFSLIPFILGFTATKIVKFIYSAFKK